MQPNFCTQHFVFNEFTEFKNFVNLKMMTWCHQNVIRLFIADFYSQLKILLHVPVIITEFQRLHWSQVL